MCGGASAVQRVYLNDCTFQVKLLMKMEELYNFILSFSWVTIRCDPDYCSCFFSTWLNPKFVHKRGVAGELIRVVATVLSYMASI